MVTKINVRYEAYSNWVKTLKDYCTIHVEFYPHGREKSMIFSFLISSENDIEPYISAFPIVCPIKKVEGGGNRLLIFPAVESMEGIKKLLSFICRMKIKGIIDQFSHAAVLGDFFHQE